MRKISKFFVGLKNLKNNRPGAIIVVDAAENAIAIQEAEVNKIPVITLSNTMVQHLPKDLKQTIICNTGSLNAIDLIMQELTQAYKSAYVAQANKTISVSKRY